MPLQFGMYGNQVQPDVMGGLRALQAGLEIGQNIRQIQAKRAEQQEMTALRSLMADPANYDPTTGQLDYRKLLPQVGKISPTQYGAFEKQAREQTEAITKGKTDRIKLLSDAINIKRQGSLTVMADPRPETAMRVLDQFAQLTGEDVSDDKQAISAMGPEELKRWAYTHALEAKQIGDMLPQMKLESFGGYRQAVGFDPVTGQPITAGEQMPMTATPGEQMTDARARAQQAEQRRQFGIREQRIGAEGGGTGAGAGKPPSGYRWSATGDLEPIPGGPADKSTKLPEAQQKQAVGVRNLNNAITNYRQKLSTFSKMDMLNPSERAKMGTAYNNMMLQAKEAFNLGVLNGPDYDILQSVIMDPRSMSAAFVSKDALDEQAAELARIMRDVGAVAGTQVGAKPRAPAPAQRFENMPNPAQYNGRIIRDDQSGTRWQSNGKQWLRVK